MGGSSPRRRKEHEVANSLSHKVHEAAPPTGRLFIWLIGCRLARRTVVVPRKHASRQVRPQRGPEVRLGKLRNALGRITRHPETPLCFARPEAVSQRLGFGTDDVRPRRRGVIISVAIACDRCLYELALPRRTICRWNAANSSS